MESKELSAFVEVPEGTEILIEKNALKVSGQKGELFKSFENTGIKLKKEGNKVYFIIKGTKRRQKSILNSAVSHFKNMIKGVNFGYVYKLKICSSHFPMAVSVNNNKVIIKNFLGEKVPRESEISNCVNVKVDGDIIIVEGIDKELTAQVGANIENATRISNRDRRRFQDGCFIIEKDGVPIR